MTEPQSVKSDEDEPYCILCEPDQPCRLHSPTGYWPDGWPDIWRGGAMFRSRKDRDA